MDRGEEIERCGIKAMDAIHIACAEAAGCMDYTTWHQRHFDNGESVRELGEKIKAFAATRRAVAEA